MFDIVIITLCEVGSVLYEVCYRVGLISLFLCFHIPGLPDVGSMWRQSFRHLRQRDHLLSPHKKLGWRITVLHWSDLIAE